MSMKITACVFMAIGLLVGSAFGVLSPKAGVADVAMATPMPHPTPPIPDLYEYLDLCEYLPITQWGIGQVVMYRDPVDADLCRFTQVLGENDPDTGEPVIRYLEDLFTLKSDQVISVFKAGTGQDLIDFIYGYGPSDYPLPVRLRVNPER